MQIARGTFKRVSPVNFFERGGPPLGWIVVRHTHVDKTADRRRTHGRWVEVRSRKASVFRLLRYSVNLAADEIVMDWVGWIDLQGRTDKESDALALTIKMVPRWRYLAMAFHHVDPAYRLSAWLGAISIVLGGLSVIIAVC